MKTDVLIQISQNKILVIITVCYYTVLDINLSPNEWAMQTHV